MKISKSSLAKYLIILGIAFWCLPAFADEIPPADPNTSTPQTETTSTPPDILPPDDTTADSSTPPIILTTTTVNLIVATGQETFSLPNLLVTACPTTDSSTIYTLNAMCALKQSGLTTDWSMSGDYMFLNSINSYTNNWPVAVWDWFSNLEYGQTALNQHPLPTSTVENLLLTYGVLPLKITADTTTPQTGTSSTISLEEFGFEGFNPVWRPSVNSNLSINSVLVENETGTYSLFVTTTDPINIFGTKPGFINSSVITITATSTPSSTTSQTLTDNNPGGGSGGSNNQPISQEKINETVEKLLNFIKSKQESDGKIIDGGTSDWLAMSFGSRNIYAQDVKNGNTSLYSYIYNYPITELDNELNNCTAYPRHILALLAGGIAATDSKITALKNKLDSCVVNNSFGANGINDDIFGLLAALAINYDQNSPVVQATLAAIQTNQQPNGAFAYPGPFEGADLTGAALNVLKYAQNKGLIIDSGIFTKAKQYLKAQQLTDGGWGYGISDALTTGWAMMGVNALGESQNEWFTASGKNPWHILTNLDTDHYTQSWDGNIDWFGTKHAIPALLGKSWPIILPSTNNTQNTPDSGSTGGSNPIASTSTENNSIIPPTSTPATTTLVIIPEVTSELTNTILVGEILGEKITSQPVVKPTPIKKQTLVAQNSDAPVVQTEASETIIETTTESTELTPPTAAITTEEPTTRAIVKIIILISASGAVLIGLYLGLKSLKK